jgi:hypothetical protein
MFLGLVYYLTIKSVAYILKFSLAAYFAISQYVFNYPAIGANHIIFAISTNLWQPYRFNWTCTELVGQLRVKAAMLVNHTMLSELVAFDVFLMSFVSLKDIDMLL